MFLINNIQLNEIFGVLELFDINELMHSLFMVYLNTIDESLISLELLNETSDCFIIKGDEERIRQILINILNNSIKYTKKGSIKFGYILQSKAIHFFVEDTGIGINDEHLVKIFDRFHQVDDMAQGTGLGLSICKAILTQMGGEIEVVSEPNKGSKFTFSIPYNRE